LTALSFLIVVFLFALWKVIENSTFFLLIVSYGFLCFCTTLWSRS
jgi:hypothetical protein